MKEINRVFAMKGLELQLGKSKEQLLKESATESKEWPMGRYEFENSLGASEKTSKIVVEYFDKKRPSNITREDIEEIVRHQRGVEELPSTFVLSDSEVESRRKLVNLIFDVYEAD